jgi:acetyltransferase-like isoleucine patch superfamily enzyme/acyl carrier protein
MTGGTPSALRRCDRVGVGVTCAGTLEVSNLGRIEIGDGVRFDSELVPSHLVTAPGGTLTIGAHVVIAHGLGLAAHHEVRIGLGAVIGPFALIMDTDFHEAGRHDAAGQTGPIHIGEGVRLGAHVTVLRGTTIGAGAVVAAGSVVTGNIAPGAHVAGVPARPARDGARAHGEGTPIHWPAVAEVIRHSFGLATVPSEVTRLDDVEQWDSLGALNLLLALEEEFAVELSAESLSVVQSAGDLVTLLLDAAERDA